MSAGLPRQTLSERLIKTNKQTNTTQQGTTSHVNLQLFANPSAAEEVNASVQVPASARKGLPARAASSECRGRAGGGSGATQMDPPGTNFAVLPSFFILSQHWRYIFSFSYRNFDYDNRFIISWFFSLCIAYFWNDITHFNMKKKVWQ